MNQKVDLNQFELPQEPKGEAVATIRRVSTENKNGEPITSKFDKKPRLLLVAETEQGFEIAEFCAMPNGKYITGKLKRIMESVGATKISELEGKQVTVAKVLTSKGNKKWSIIGNGKQGNGAQAPAQACNATCLLKDVPCSTCQKKREYFVDHETWIVEAWNEEDAEKIALERVENGDVPEICSIEET